MKELIPFTLKARTNKRGSMNLDLYFSKLKANEINKKEYLSLRKQCIRLVYKACNRYQIDRILFNQVVKKDTIDNIFTKSIMKSLKGFKKEKGSFSTYFFYKACSAARVEVGKLKKRIRINNTFSLDETYYSKQGKE